MQKKTYFEPTLECVTYAVRPGDQIVLTIDKETLSEHGLNLHGLKFRLSTDNINFPTIFGM